MHGLSRSSATGPTGKSISRLCLSLKSHWNAFEISSCPIRDIGSYPAGGGLNLQGIYSHDTLVWIGHACSQLNRPS